MGRRIGVKLSRHNHSREGVVKNFVFSLLDSATHLALALLTLTAVAIVNPLCSVADDRPNFIVIITDDQNSVDLEVMPQTRKLLFERGLTFNQGSVTTPWCSPSRASLLTGVYASRHAVIGNTDRLEMTTIAEVLKPAGYFTGIIGKYLNSWKGEYRTEFDYWRVFKGGNVGKWNPLFNENGVWEKRIGHIAPIMAGYISEFLDLAAQQDEPFLLIWAPNIPHRVANPEPQYKKALIDYELPSFPNSGCVGRKGKPRYVRNTPCSFRDEGKFHRNQLRTLLSVDNIIAELIGTLEASSALSKTAIFFISDNGLLRGTFGLNGKPYPYKDTVRVPFAVRYDRGIWSPRESDQLVANIDIPATIYDLADVAPPYQLDGKSLVPIFNVDLQHRPALLFEGFSDERIDGSMKRPFVGVFDGRFTLIINKGDIPELYDEQNDPYQMKNIWRRTSVKQKLRELFNTAAESRPDINSSEWIKPSVAGYLAGDS